MIYYLLYSKTKRANQVEQGRATPILPLLRLLGSLRTRDRKGGRSRGKLYDDPVLIDCYYVTSVVLSQVIINHTIR